MKAPNRREFVRLAVAGAAGMGLSALGCRRPAPPAPLDAATPGAATPAPLRTFSSSEMAIVAAICERLLPRDEDPGAIDLGVPAYLDAALASDDLRGHRDLVLRVLPILDRQSKERHGGRGFAVAAPDEQDSLLAAYQFGRGGDHRFFDVLLSLTLEGAFGDPRHGGNAGGRGFALIGFRPGPEMRKPPAQGG